MKLKHKLPTATLFDEISAYWTEISNANATKKQIDFVRNNVNPEGLVLDLGCGTGRHAVPLCEAGYGMVGLDISMRLLQIAKKKAAEAGASPMWVRSDMRFVPFRSGVFEVVVSLDASFGYLPSENADLQSLKEASRSLREKGVFLLDVFNRERMVRRYGKSVGFGFWSLLFGLLPKFPRFAGLFRWREYPSFYLLQKRSVTEKGEKLLDLWVFREKKTGKIRLFLHVARLYSFPQLQMMLKKAGFQIMRLHGGYEGQEYSENASRLIVVAHKN